MDIFKASASGDIQQLLDVLDECPHDIDVRNWMWQTPLMVACIHNQYEAAQLLIERGADLLAKDRESGWTPFHHCMYRGHFAIGALIVKARRDHWRQNCHGTPPLTPLKSSAQGGLRRHSSSGGKHALKRGSTALSRHGFKVVLKSPLEMEDFDGQRPYDLVRCPCVHGGTFKCLEKFKGAASEARAVADYKEMDADDTKERRSYHTLVYSFGMGTNYQLGYSCQGSHQVKPKKVKSLDSEGVRRIATDSAGSFAISESGRCYSWGLGQGGRLGLETKADVQTKSSRSRFQIEPCRMVAFGLKTMKDVATHGALGGALSSKGNLYAWGTFTLEAGAGMAGGSYSLGPAGNHEFEEPGPGSSCKRLEEVRGNVEAVQAVRIGPVPRKIPLRGVRFARISAARNRVCLVGCGGRLYVLGQSLEDGLRFHAHPTPSTQFTNVWEAAATARSVIVLTRGGEVLQQDQGVHSYHRIRFPRCMGFEKQQLLSARRHGGGARRGGGSHAHNKREMGPAAVHVHVRIRSISADPAGRHALAVSSLGNLFAWTAPGVPDEPFPIAPRARVPWGRRP
eukprot:CAMPEP_0114498732 /NCGR_PEP_ID=MMETSP0109-20121206/7031_1 /TAXON_ID=29199 /ORGANISM="Chlorarachnion reptans, Strain CCCM449" /LENGTH=566 /DNA_ID=CAMNT_0001676233 /DNA_START=228 /DNA_END=1924 /DNA_ORIENTATION=-